MFYGLFSSRHCNILSFLLLFLGSRCLSRFRTYIFRQALELVLKHILACHFIFINTLGGKFRPNKILWKNIYKFPNNHTQKKSLVKQVNVNSGKALQSLMHSVKYSWEYEISPGSFSMFSSHAIRFCGDQKHKRYIINLRYIF